MGNGKYSGRYGMCGQKNKKMKWYRFLISVMQLAFASASAQDTTNTCSNKDFDFWIGHWKIEQEILTAKGDMIKLKASNRVQKELNGCIITENWKGDVQFFWEGMTKAENISAYSVRSYNYTDSTWSIYWADTRSKKIGNPYIGKFIDRTGEFYRTENNSKTKITFSGISKNSVTWTLSLFQSQTDSWLVIWRMVFSRRE